jgi:hypothetical protein
MEDNHLISILISLNQLKEVEELILTIITTNPRTIIRNPQSLNQITKDNYHIGGIKTYKAKIKAHLTHSILSMNRILDSRRHHKTFCLINKQKYFLPSLIKTWEWPLKIHFKSTEYSKDKIHLVLLKGWTVSIQNQH